MAAAAAAAAARAQDRDDDLESTAATVTTVSGATVARDDSIIFCYLLHFIFTLFSYLNRSLIYQLCCFSE